MTRRRNVTLTVSDEVVVRDMKRVQQYMASAVGEMVRDTLLHEGIRNNTPVYFQALPPKPNGLMHSVELGVDMVYTPLEEHTINRRAIGTATHELLERQVKSQAQRRADELIHGRKEIEE